MRGTVSSTVRAATQVDRGEADHDHGGHDRGERQLRAGTARSSRRARRGRASPAGRPRRCAPPTPSAARAPRRGRAAAARRSDFTTPLIRWATTSAAQPSSGPGRQHRGQRRQRRGELRRRPRRRGTRRRSSGPGARPGRRPAPRSAPRARSRPRGRRAATRPEARRRRSAGVMHGRGTRPSGQGSTVAGGADDPLAEDPVGPALVDAGRSGVKITATTVMIVSVYSVDDAFVDRQAVGRVGRRRHHVREERDEEASPRRSAIVDGRAEERPALAPDAVGEDAADEAPAAASTAVATAAGLPRSASVQPRKTTAATAAASADAARRSGSPGRARRPPS